jgi:hypothetical protein
MKVLYDSGLYVKYERSNNIGDEVALFNMFESVKFDDF